MSDTPQEPVEAAEAVAEPARPAKSPRKWRRWARRLLVVLTGLIAAFLFTIFTVDIGDISIGGRSLRTIAESRGSKFLERTLTIGAIHAKLMPGTFELENVTIAGPNPGDRPFFSARRIHVKVPLTRLLWRQANITVELDGWRMVVERWPDGFRIPNMKLKTPPGPKRWDIQVPYVFAHNGEFVYDDHQAPWSVTAPNLQFSIVRDVARNQFVGNAEFSEGTVRIQDFLPMRADFRTRFRLEGSTAHLLSLDLITDGAHSRINGYVNFGAGVEQQYNIESDIDFSRMRDIFFRSAPWRLSGKGLFTGIFKIGGRFGRNLTGEFRSEEFGLGIGNTEWRLPHLHGALEWTSKSFIVSHAESDFLGGGLRLAYSLGPFGQPGGAHATLTGDYDHVDLYRLTRQFGWTALEPQGRVAGGISMEWRNGHFGETLKGTGRAAVTPPAGQTLATEALPPSDEEIPPEVPFQAYRPLGEFGIGAESSFNFTSSSLDFEPGWVATPSTFVRFHGRARGGPVNLAFKVTSHDWQRSDRLFTAIMSNFNRPTAAIEVGGRGTFDGTLTRAFTNPRIAGHFTGRAMRAWKVVWGRAAGDLVVDERYLELKDAVVDHPSGGRILTSGKYSLGTRTDGLDEIDAQIHVERVPLEPLKTAFTLTDWPITGTLATADLHLKGRYDRPAGGGQMRIENGTAWTESFTSVASNLEFGGDGSLQLSAMQVQKGQGSGSGSAWLSWADKKYAFNLSSTGLQIEDLALAKVEFAPFSGRLALTATGAGSFDSAEWALEGRVPDLYIGDEGIGLAVFKLSFANNLLTIEKLTANSGTQGRFRADCTGTVETIALNEARLQCSVTETSIDPYLKFFMRDMPLTRGIVTGSATLTGPLRDRTRLNASLNLSSTHFQLYDYTLNNDGPIQISYRNDRFSLDRLRFAGQDTEGLEFAGNVDLKARTANVKASGKASLAVLQAFYPSLTTSGTATLSATMTGSFDNLEVRGRADLENGEFRHRDMPHRLRLIRGPISMEAGRISVDGLKAVIGEGEVLFGGEILLDGYRPVEYDLKAEGRSMHLRYPAGLQSTADADLRLTGPVLSPTLSGTVDILHATYAMREEQTNYISLLTGAFGGDEQRLVVDEPLPPTVPLTLAIEVRAGPPSIAFVDNKNAQLWGTGEVYIAGTIDRPIVTGRLRIDKAEWVFAGNRYKLLTGSVDFSNPDKFEPFFDVTAETEIRQHGQSYRITVRVTGTLDKLEPVLTSDPWLPDFTIVSMLLGETPDVGSQEVRARLAPQDLQAEALRAAGVAILTSPISATVGTAAQRLTRIDSVQIVAVLNEATLSGNPSARIILGKRISNRVYLTYSRTLTGAQNELILVEYDQNDHVSWVLSRNEDRSFALDFRLRYTFR